MPLKKIVSGGQSGADRAALDVAIERGFEVGGWVPADRQAEDGPIPMRYPDLIETESPNPAVRTVRNVRDADATLVVSNGPLAGGSLLTFEEARRRRKPVLHLDLQRTGAEGAATRLREWLTELDPAVLNIAGPRASEDPTIFNAVAGLLRAALPAERRASEA